MIKIANKILVSALLIAIILPVSLILVLPVEAAASLYLSSSSTSVGQGQTFTVSINVNTGGEAVNAVEAVVNFPADKLKANYISHSGSAFDIKAEDTIGNGVVVIAKGKLPPAVVGNNKVATIGFTALSQGTASVSISSGKVLREADSGNIFSAGSGTTISIGPAAEVPTSEQPPEQPRQPLAISEVKVLSLGIQTATVVWKTNIKADSQVEYGFKTDRTDIEPSYFFSAYSEELITDHEIALDPKTLVAGHLYHFKVKSKDDLNNQVESEDELFLVPGYNLTIIITDEASKKLSGVKVRLPTLGLEAYTDENGRVQFKDLPLGIVSVLTETDGDKQQKEVRIAADDNQLTLVLAKRAKRFDPLIVLGVVLVILIILLSTSAWLIWKKKIKLPFMKDPPIYTPPGIGGNKP